MKNQRLASKSQSNVILIGVKSNKESKVERRRVFKGKGKLLLEYT